MFILQAGKTWRIVFVTINDIIIENTQPDKVSLLRSKPIVLVREIVL